MPRWLHLVRSGRVGTPTAVGDPPHKTVFAFFLIRFVSFLLVFVVMSLLSVLVLCCFLSALFARHKTTNEQPEMNEMNLQRAWNVNQVSTKEDWEEWIRRFSLELLKEAPSAALRACAPLAQVA